MRGRSATFLSCAAAASGMHLLPAGVQCNARPARPIPASFACPGCPGTRDWKYQLHRRSIARHPHRWTILAGCGAPLAWQVWRAMNKAAVRRQPFEARMTKSGIASSNDVGLDHLQASMRKETREDAALQRLRNHAKANGGKCFATSYVNRITKVWWECEDGHRWQATSNSVLNHQSWCPQCARARQRITLQQLQDFARAQGGQCLSKKYRNCHEKLSWQCQLGHTWDATASSILHGGTWCPECAHRSKKPLKRTLQHLQDYAASLRGRCLATAYSGMSTQVTWQCHEGHVWQARPYAVLGKGHSWCPVCAGRVPVGLQRLQEHAAHLGGQCLATEYVNCRLHVRWKCKHGHVWHATPNTVLNRGRWCPHCRKIGLPRLRAHATSLRGNCLAKQYKNKTEKLTWECKVGHRWKASANNVLHGKTWCPQCAAGKWRTEAEIRSILEAIFHPLKFESGYPAFLDGLQLDGHCPELSLAFEYQGEQHYDPHNYFHFGDFSNFRAQQERDARKLRLCRDAQVRLLLVPYVVNDKRTFVVTALLQWFSLAELTPNMLAG